MTQINPASASPDREPKAPEETAQDAVLALIKELTLSPPQVAAIRAIMAGGTPTAAARVAGVHRGTLYRWMKDDPNFAEALERCRSAVRFSVRDQMHTMADDCIEAISTAIYKGNSQIALQVLKLMGAFEKLPKTRDLRASGKEAMLPQQETPLARSEPCPGEICAVTSEPRSADASQTA